MIKFRITMQIQKFFNGILPLWDKDEDAPASHGWAQLIISIFYFTIFLIM